jgi:hypothetical protein
MIAGLFVCALVGGDLGRAERLPASRLDDEQSVPLVLRQPDWVIRPVYFAADVAPGDQAASPFRSRAVITAAAPTASS